MRVAVARETYPGERRVALVPAHVPAVMKTGLQVLVESGAGESAGFADQAYRDKGALIVATRDEVFAADIVAQVRSFGANQNVGQADLSRMRTGLTVIGMCDPLGETKAIEQIATTGITQFALELIPRTTRAQSMDVLSSMATIAGYRAVLLSAVELPKIFPMFMTAAGTLTAAKAFVIGAGVAGLQAIATCRRLGAVVRAYDVRPAVREQVESLGAKFVELPLAPGEAAEGQGGYAREMDEDFYRRQRELMASVVAESDVVITTAAIPGKTSPLLITESAVKGMQPGSVIVDLAAERGGNCEVTMADQRVELNGVTVLGPTNLPSEIPHHASQLYSGNITAFLTNLVKKGELLINLEDPIILDTLATHGGQVASRRLRELLGKH